MQTTQTVAVSRRRYLSIAIWSVLVVYSIAHFLYSGVIAAWTSPGGDFLSAFPGPLALRMGQTWPALSRDWIEGALGMGPLKWNYGPVLHIVTLPFALAATEGQAMRAILLVDYALIAATMAIWFHLLRRGREGFHGNGPDPLFPVLCLWLNYFPLLEAVTGREIEIAELFLVTVGIWALRRERETVAGVAFGVAAMTKFLPAIYLPYLFVKGFRRAGLTAAGTALSIALLAQPLLGWQRSATLLIARSEVAGTDFRTSYANQALPNILYKMFTGFDASNPHPPTWYPNVLRPIAYAASFGLLVATSWFVYRWRRGRLIELECALLAIVMCLVSSHANTYYFVFALPALSLGIAAIQRDASRVGLPSRLALGGAVVLSGFLVPMKVFEVLTGTRGVVVARVLQAWSLPAFGVILAAGLMVELHRVSRGELRPYSTIR